ncbi:MAG: hypothetical protein ABIG71_00210 [Candidatus Uhrbacteria bacterium]
MTIEMFSLAQSHSGLVVCPAKDFGIKGAHRGDRLVRALQGDTDFREFRSRNALGLIIVSVTEPMSLVVAHGYIDSAPSCLGPGVHRCLGLVLSEDNRVVLFDKPIIIFAHSRSALRG